jgi:hypothetical protein
MVPILLHKAAESPLHDDDDPSCSDYNNWIPITYPRITFTRLLGQWTFFGFANWGNGSGSFTSV